MRKAAQQCVPAIVCLVMAGAAPSAAAATLYVGPGGDLQAALNAAQQGDLVLLEAGAEFVGNFVLPVKSGTLPIVVRSSTPDGSLPGAGQRITPAHAPLLARLRSPNTAAALRTAAAAARWHLQYLEFAWNQDGTGDIIQLGDGSSAQNTLSKVPHDLVLSHVYVHGHPDLGQKRCISLNAAHTTIRDSHISDCKGVGMDTQAIAGWNGPGPYTIENNYLEGAGENVLFGGSDPAIPDVVASDVVIRRNYFSRPMRWRTPILATPEGLTAEAEAGGSLAAGTYAYRIVARGPVGRGTIGRSNASAEVSTTMAGGGAVRIRWQSVPGATEYRVYGRTSGGQSMYWRVTGTEFVDAGTAGTAEAVPTSEGTVWTVKNIFELKNARHVLVEHNILENHWKQAQPGWAIVLTPRNSGGACTWCVVEDVTFQYNLVRNVAAGINILGYDDTAPSRQAARLIFRQNVFHDVTSALGGNGWFMQIGGAPRDITIESNTIDHNGTSVVYVYGGTSTNPAKVYGFRMTHNAARHNAYGMFGQHFSYGNAILTAYYPDGVFLTNYLAGGSASRYPAGNYFSGLFQDQFVDTAARNFTVRDDSILKMPGIGADFPALQQALAGVDTGHSPSGNTAPTASFAAACSNLSCSFTDASTDSDGSVAAWAWSFGDGATSDVRHPTHTYAAPGPYVVTLLVADNGGASASTNRTITVTAPNAAPSASFTFTCTDLTCSFTDTSTDADGQVVAWSWSFGGGAQSTTRHPTHTFSASGPHAVTLTVTDNQGETAAMTRTVSVTAANAAPVASFSFTCAALTCAFTDASTDADGTVQTWNWSFGNGMSSTARHPSHTYAAAGTYTVVLAVGDNHGATASTSRVVTVGPQAHVGDLSSSAVKRGSTWGATVTIVVHAEDERPLAGALVSAAWSSGSGGTGAATNLGVASCTTGSNGACSVTMDSLANKHSTVTLTVQSVAAADRTYVSAANHDPDGNSNGTAITVRRP